MDNLNRHRQIHGLPGENPDFYSQIDDLENYVVHNKRAPIN